LLFLFISLVLVLNVSLANGLFPVYNQGLRVFLSSLDLGLSLLLELLASKEFLLLCWGHVHDVLFGVVGFHDLAVGINDLNAGSFVKFPLTDLLSKLLDVFLTLVCIVGVRVLEAEAFPK
jgi:hypothetical protein